MRHRSFAVVAVLTCAALPIAGARAGAGLVSGAAAQNITPYTQGEGSDPLSAPHASNPDGLPGGLWHTFEPEPGFASAGQVTPSGVWGETFADENGNKRWDVGERFVDDPVNTRLDPGSAGKYDGVYMAGFGNDRIPKGAFDAIWARALYLRDQASGRSFAHVSLDVLGWFGDWNDRVVRLVRAMEPSLDLDHLVVSHTHDHESVDAHVGLWGLEQLVDGTYPKWERYVEVKIAQAVVEAAREARPAEVLYGRMRPGHGFVTVRGNEEDLEGLQSRNSCRTPWVFDDELRVMHVREPEGAGIGTIVNWGTHVESMEDRNLYLSSDFVHTIRETVEQELGGVAVYVPGAQGAGEVVGDSCVSRWRRDTFDGEGYPLTEGGRPIVVERAGTEPLGARDRTYALGRVVGSAAVRAIQAASPDPAATSIGFFAERSLFVPANNAALAALTAAGVIDKPTYVNGRSVGAETLGAVGSFMTGITGVDVKTTLYGWRIGSASFVTAPGELFPEMYLGLSRYNRARADGDANDYVEANPEALACAGRSWSYGSTRGASTGRAHEPGIREAQLRAFGTEHNFLFGYTPDLLGYIVPGYDFAWYAAPGTDGVGIGALHGVAFEGEAPDPCRDIPPDLAFPNSRYGRHYQETNSAGSMLGPAYACEMWLLLEQNPFTSSEGGDACRDWFRWRNAGGLLHVGTRPVVCDPSSDTDCVRHY